MLTLARWTALCAAAETLGMTAAAGAAKASQAIVGEQSTGPETAAALSLVVAGGLVEGVALGTAQASGLARVLPGLDRRRWVLVTVVVAGVGWAAASAPAALRAGDDGTEPRLALVLAGAAALGAGMGAALGAAQALVLRGQVPRPGRWVGANAVAWAPAMAVIFLGATTPSSDWSVTSVLGLGAVTGAAAGTVLGLVTGRFLPSHPGSTTSWLPRRDTAPVRVTVRVQPGSSRPRVGGEHAGALVVRVAARAVDGRATEAALAAVAEAFGVPRRQVTLVRGATSRTKVVDVSGGDPAVLTELLAADPPGRSEH